MIEEILRKKYRPYEEVELLPRRMVTWNSERVIFEELIRSIKPRRIIEVGSWLGGSAIRMAEICKRDGINAQIICVDTWLGGYDQIMSELPQDDLCCQAGYPGLYRQFVSNVIHAGFEKVIVPFPQVSIYAARFFARLNAKAELIYIDGSHERIDVLSDMGSYWPLTSGVMFGDDIAMPGVGPAVARFCSIAGVKAFSDGVHWKISRTPPA